VEGNPNPHHQRLNRWHPHEYTSSLQTVISQTRRQGINHFFEPLHLIG
jgi:hypothetical protein